METNRTSAESPTLTIRRADSPHRILVKKSKLLVVSGALQGREFIIDRDTYSIGSGPHNDMILDDSTVSRRHCEIQRRPDGFLIRDLGSTNGTLVQGVRVTEAFLEQGTEFQLGKVRVVFCPLLETMEYEVSPRGEFGRIVGSSVAMRRVFHLAETYAPTDATMLIEGESGTGKDLLAEEVHAHSPRRDKPFVVVDCASLAHDLVTSEFFGHLKGSFTGAGTDRVGAFEHADGGTVFINEIGVLSPELQPKLLRVIEKREVRKVGSNEVRKVDVRIICATNQRLDAEVNAGRFREDLYYRLSIVRIEMPPLRRRKEDIPLLLKRFLEEYYGEKALEYVADFDRTLKAFMIHDWPGNVRELKNVVELASYSGKKPFDLAAFLTMGHLTARAAESPEPVYSADRPFKDAKQDLVTSFERGYIEDLLRKHGGNVSKAAREAGIERAYLQRLIEKHAVKE